MSITVPLVALLYAFTLAQNRFPITAPGHSDGSYWVAGIVGALFFFVSLLAHEVGHALVARREGIGVEGISLWLLGGVAKLEHEADNAGAELRIAGIGPLTSFAVGVVFWFFHEALSGGTGLTELYVELFGWLAFINILLAAFNLLPGSPLDGGRGAERPALDAHPRPDGRAGGGGPLRPGTRCRAPRCRRAALLRRPQPERRLRPPGRRLHPLQRDVRAEGVGLDGAAPRRAPLRGDGRRPAGPAGVDDGARPRRHRPPLPAPHRLPRPRPRTGASAACSPPRRCRRATRAVADLRLSDLAFPVDRVQTGRTDDSVLVTLQRTRSSASGRVLVLHPDGRVAGVAGNDVAERALQVQHIRQGHSAVPA